MMEEEGIGSSSWLHNSSSWYLGFAERGREMGAEILSGTAFEINRIAFSLHFLFVVLYIVFLYRKGCFRQSNPDAAALPKDCRLYKSQPQTECWFKAAFTSCLWLFGVNIVTLSLQASCWLWNGCLSEPARNSVVPHFMEAVAWLVMAFAAKQAQAAQELRYPPVLRIWWTASFLLCFCSLILEIQEEIRSSDGILIIPTNLCASALSFPAAAFLGAISVFGGKIVQVYSANPLKASLLPEQNKENDVGQNHSTLYASAGFFSRLTLSWLNPLLSVGAAKPLEMKDIPQLAPQDKSETSHRSLKANWDKPQNSDSSNSNRAHSLTWAIALTFWREAGYTAIFAAVNTFASYVGPYLVDDFVEYLNGRSRFEYEGYALASVFFVSKLLETVAQRQWYLGIDILGMHVRSALTAFVYQKGLCLSNQSRQSHTSGEIINYMAVDVQRVGDFSWYLHDIWVLPLQIVLAVTILYRTVGLACIATLVATTISIISNTPVAKLQENYQDELMTAKDERMRATMECLRSMRILKLQAWERRYYEKLKKLRLTEYAWLQKALYTQSAVTFIFWGAPIFVSVVTFASCLLLGIPLTAGRVLSALATFRVLQEPLRNFPDLVSMIAQTKVSVDRLSFFLHEEESKQDTIIHLEKDESNLAIEIKDGEFSWDPNFGTPTLSGINVSITKGTRVAVCGTVGSGKSSFLSCLLGEIPKTSGTVKICGKTAYVSQSAWIQTGIVEDNVLFGQPMDKVMYKNVLEVCELQKDLSLLSYGDQTMIGERGINLSGGQKQRVQLARALYKDTDIYLLDDPFSAVDAHTGSQLFKECILGALALKTVVYVTHQVEFLPAADIILVLRNGEIIQAGKYDELLQAGTDFESLVTAHNEAIEAMDAADSLQNEVDVTEATSYLDVSSVDSNKSCDIKDAQKYQGGHQGCLERPKSFSKVIVKKDMPKSRRKKKQIIQEEEREKGSVKFYVYWSYMTAAYGGFLVPLIILAQSAFQLLQISSNWWMAWASPASQGEQLQTGSVKLILVYMALSFSSALCVFIRAVLVAIVGLKASQKLFTSMLNSIFCAPMAFFDSTPAGRILNRVSVDQSVVDLDIPFRLSGFAATTIQLIGIIGVMAQVTWQVFLLFIPVVAACLWMQKYYMASARELTRLAGIQKSPIIHHFSESIAGVATIRGFKEEERFKRTNLYLLDLYARPYFNSVAAIEWLCLRMELLSTLVFAFLMFLLVSFAPGTIDASKIPSLLTAVFASFVVLYQGPILFVMIIHVASSYAYCLSGMAGLAVSYGLTLNARQSRWVLSLCKIENKVISIERIQQYSRIPSEAPLVLEDSRPPTNWPSLGSVEFHQLKVRYSENFPVVLHGISCKFPGGQKIGIVGRTGSGKSTLIQALFRMVEPSGGSIIIDGIDIAKIGLHDLRSRLSIIPQDPTLFEGTMRANLDPLRDYSDSQIWEVLDKCQLGDVVHSKEDKLDTIVSENGENWSVGQRQLVCLGRVLLRQTRILVLDEATASVDTATDGVVQRTIRNEFQDCTVITVAHRIPTVIDSDLVLVLSDGRIAEYDSPAKLLEDKSSLFFKLVSEYSLRSSSMSDFASII